MKTRTALPLALALVAAAGATVPAVAAPKAKPKPVTAAYDLQLAPVPAPLVGLTDAPLDGPNSCVDTQLEGISIDTRTIKVVGPGVLTVDVGRFAGDWDITVLNGAGKVLGVGAGTTTLGEAPVIGNGNGSLGTDLKEKATIKVKRATELKIAVCNYLGGPSASVKYTYTYS